MCSHCSRLRQNCYYADERERDRQESERSFDRRSASPIPRPRQPSVVAGGATVLVSFFFFTERLGEIDENRY